MSHRDGDRLMATIADLAVTRTLLRRMVDAITAADDVQEAWPAAELAELAADVRAEVRNTRVWTLS
jgi:beta-phosphoglucomutase-like phosphatase (HAD superfamily)